MRRLAAYIRALVLPEILCRAKRYGMGNAARVPVRGKASGISNSSARPRHRYDLSCGCKTFYPGSARVV